MTRETILLAGADLARQPDLAATIAGAGHEVLVCREREEAIRTLRGRAVDVLIAEVGGPESEDRSFLESAASLAPEAALIVLAEPDAEVPQVERIERVQRPVARRALTSTLSELVERKHAEHEHETLTDLLGEPYRLGCITTGSRTMAAALQTLTRAARGVRPLLIEGERGTGKTLLARVLHFAGSTRDHPYLAARGKRLTVHRLLGWRRGAFPDAESDRAGLLESANGGTLCIHDVNELPRDAQDTLSDALDTGIIVRCGEQRPREIHLRIVAACRGDLREPVGQRRFRAGLRYRLAEVHLRLPPLRERVEEIPALAALFVEKHRGKLAPDCPGVSAQALDVMGRHDWPGNVRELENVVTHALIQCRGGRIEPDDLPHDLVAGRWACAANDPIDLRAACADFERRHLLRVLERCHFERRASATTLGIGLSSLYRKMKEHGITAGRCVHADNDSS